MRIVSHNSLLEVVLVVFIEYCATLLGAYKLCKARPDVSVDSWLNAATLSGVSTTVLGVLRLSFGLYYLGIGLIWHFILYPNSWHYFTNWNIILIIVYNMLAVCALALKFDEDKFSQHTTDIFGYVLCKLFAVVATSSFFTTIVTFSLISDNLDFWNVVMHLTTSIAMLIEIILNKIHVQIWDFAFPVSWSLLYLIFVWSVVGSGVKEWPYEFLRTDSSECIVWYSALLLGNVFLFFVVFGLSSSKALFLDHYTEGVRFGNDDIALVDESASMQNNCCKLWSKMCCMNSHHTFQQLPPSVDDVYDSDYIITL